MSKKQRAEVTPLGRFVTVEFTSTPIKTVSGTNLDGTGDAIRGVQHPIKGGNEKEGFEYASAEEAAKLKRSKQKVEFEVKKALILACVQLAGQPLTKGPEKGTEKGTLAYYVRQSGLQVSQEHLNTFASELQQAGLLTRGRIAGEGAKLFCQPTKDGLAAKIDPRVVEVARKLLKK